MHACKGAVLTFIFYQFFIFPNKEEQRITQSLIFSYTVDSLVNSTVWPLIFVDLKFWEFWAICKKKIKAKSLAQLISHPQHSEFAKLKISKPVICIKLHSQKLNTIYKAGSKNAVLKPSSGQWYKTQANLYLQRVIKAVIHSEDRG